MYLKKFTKEVKKEFIKNKLATSKQWACHALLLVYSFQTATEQEQQSTSDLNGIGFTGSDAEILSSFANQFEKKGYLSEKQMSIIHKKMPKYWQQVLNNSDVEKLENIIAGAQTPA